MSDVTIVNRDNVDVSSRGLPLPLRLALRFISRFEYGCLEIGLPDGRRYAVAGRQEGPSAAIGEAHWPRYFAQLRDRLGPDGRVGIQAITIQDRLFTEYRRSVDFIRGYVFPGGMLPTPQVLVDLGRRHGLALAGERVFGQDYVRTLSDWRTRFRSAWPSIEQMGFDERFRRLWEYYLAYCEAGFRSGTIDVRQMVFARQS